MKYFKRLNKFKASNLELDLDNLKAYSYEHWSFLKVINGVLVFNKYNYSVTTSKHQNTIYRLLRATGYQSKMLEIRSPYTLDRVDSVNSAIDLLQVEINALKEQINKKGTRKAKNKERQDSISLKESEIETLRALKNGELKDQILSESEINFIKQDLKNHGLAQLQRKAIDEALRESNEEYLLENFEAFKSLYNVRNFVLFDNVSELKTLFFRLLDVSNKATIENALEFSNLPDFVTHALKLKLNESTLHKTLLNQLSV